MTDEDDDDQPLHREPIAQNDDDSSAPLRGMQRVSSVKTVFKAIHHDPPPDVPPPRGEPAVQLRMVAWQPPKRSAPMATMSDLARRGTQGGTPTVAQVGLRPQTAPFVKAPPEDAE